MLGHFENLSNKLSSNNLQLFLQLLQQLFRNSSAKIKTYYDVVPWCSGLTRLPVKEEIGSSNLLGIAIKILFK